MVLQCVIILFTPLILNGGLTWSAPNMVTFGTHIHYAVSSPESPPESNRLQLKRCRWKGKQTPGLFNDMTLVSQNLPHFTELVKLTKRPNFL